MAVKQNTKTIAHLLLDLQALGRLWCYQSPGSTAESAGGSRHHMGWAGATKETQATLGMPPLEQEER